MFCKWKTRGQVHDNGLINTEQPATPNGRSNDKPWTSTRQTYACVNPVDILSCGCHVVVPLPSHIWCSLSSAPLFVNSHLLVIY